MTFCALRDRYIADAVSRHGQRLGPRVSDKRICIIIARERHILICIYQFSVRLITDQIYSMSELLLCLSEHISHLIESLSRVDLARRIVRVVQHDSLHFRNEQFAQSFCVRIKVESRICRNLYNACAPVACPVAVLYEIRSKHDQLIAWVKNAFIDHIDRISSATRHDDMIYIEEVSSGSFVKIISYGFSGRFVSGI